MLAATDSTRSSGTSAGPWFICTYWGNAELDDDVCFRRPAAGCARPGADRGGGVASSVAWVGAEAVRRSATEVCQSVLAFAQGFLSITNEADSSSSSQSKEDYLVRTGTVHECIEKIRKSLPESNAGAVKNLWLQDRAMLDDSFAEVNTMIEEGGDGNESDEGFGDDDDLLDELGLGTTKSLSSIEIERVKKVGVAQASAVIILANAP